MVEFFTILFIGAFVLACVCIGLIALIALGTAVVWVIAAIIVAISPRTS